MDLDAAAWQHQRDRMKPKQTLKRAAHMAADPGQKTYTIRILEVKTARSLPSREKMTSEIGSFLQSLFTDHLSFWHTSCHNDLVPTPKEGSHGMVSPAVHRLCLMPGLVRVPFHLAWKRVMSRILGKTLGHREEETSKASTWLRFSKLHLASPKSTNICHAHWLCKIPTFESARIWLCNPSKLLGILWPWILHGDAIAVLFG